MSVKSIYGKSTDLNTIEDLQINEELLNKINIILTIVLEENKSLSNYKERVISQKICHLLHRKNLLYQLKIIYIVLKIILKPRIIL